MQCVWKFSAVLGQIISAQSFCVRIKHKYRKERVEKHYKDHQNIRYNGWSNQTIQVSSFLFILLLLFFCCIYWAHKYSVNRVWSFSFQKYITKNFFLIHLVEHFMSSIEWCRYLGIERIVMFFTVTSSAGFIVSKFFTCSLHLSYEQQAQKKDLQ